MSMCSSTDHDQVRSSQRQGHLLFSRAAARGSWLDYTLLLAMLSWFIVLPFSCSVKSTNLRQKRDGR